MPLIADHKITCQKCGGGGKTGDEGLHHGGRRDRGIAVQVVADWRVADAASKKRDFVAESLPRAEGAGDRTLFVIDCDLVMSTRKLEKLV